MSAALILFAALAGAPAATAPCQPQPLARRWLEQQLPHWQATLAQQPGYRPPADLQVCALHARRPYADISRSRIYVAPPDNSNDTVALVHEYLHLALAGHPHGRDEAYVEALARRLVRLEAVP
jgi:uncharacterized protein YfaQ (DUF2300 family)